jgi:NADH-quinone oxidoreductase subunit L
MELNLELLIWLIPVFPFLAFGLIALFTNRWNALSHWIAIGALLISFVLGMIVFVNAVGEGGHEMGVHPFENSQDWLPTGDTFLRFGVLGDPLTAVVLFFVLVTLLAIFVYSVGYMNYGTPHQDPRYARFFALISLFATGMLGLVVSDNLLMLFIFWEIMGFCSYALIGFWYDKNYPDPKQITPRQAGIKAFITTRVGDVLFLLGIAYLYSQTGTLSFRVILNDPHVLEGLVEASAPVFGLSAAGLIGLLIFAGTVGKSAQFPLHVWLPDAMEGPTPVSALIHAATMVSAGVYLVIRTFPLLAAGLGHDGGVGTTPMIAMGLIGSFTAFFAASIAMAQFDVKKVLAYSTISQLGYMVAALGVGAYIAAAFHLITHAFFKALLFLGSGSVIHGMEHGHHAVGHDGHDEHKHEGHEEAYFDPQDMRNMGGLKAKMPWTFWTFLIGGMALSGLPFITAGFWSKDEILAEAFHSGADGSWLGWVVFILLAVSALMTAFYTMRQITMTFLGKPRTGAAAHAHESSWWMVAPLVMLSVFAIGFGWLGIPDNFLGLDLGESNWVHHFVIYTLPEELHHATLPFSFVPLLASLVVALGGLFLGYRTYKDKLSSPETPDPMSLRLGGLFTHMHRKWYFDELYDAAFVRPTKAAAAWTYEFVDRTIIDGILHTVARVTERYAELNRLFDRVIINGAADAVAESVKAFGRNFRQIQTGQVQNYLFLALINALVLVIVYLALFQ